MDWTKVSGLTFTGMEERSAGTLLTLVATWFRIFVITSERARVIPAIRGAKMAAVERMVEVTS